MSVPKNWATPLQEVKRPMWAIKRSNFWSLRGKSPHLKNIDPLLDVAVSYLEHS
jgi:hypothetical protein